MSYNSGVIMLIILNHPRALCSSDLKSLAGESLNCTSPSPIYTMTSNNNYYNNSNSNNGNNYNHINNQILIELASVVQGLYNAILYIETTRRS